MPWIAAKHVLEKIIKRFEATILIDEILSNQREWAIEDTLGLIHEIVPMINPKKDDGVQK